MRQIIVASIAAIVTLWMIGPNASNIMPERCLMHEDLLTINGITDLPGHGAKVVLYERGVDAFSDYNHEFWTPC